MCGVLSVISRKNVAIDKDRLLGAGKKMAHKGPDAQQDIL